METSLATRPEPAALVRSSGALVPSNIGDAIKLAELMCKASLVPNHLQGKPADCLLVIEQAQRWGLSPFAVAQCTSVIQGKLMFEGKLVAAVINARGELARRLDYEYSGEGNSRKVRVFARIHGEDKDREVEVHLSKARTSNRQWDSQPDQQLAYHGARVWARRFMPELMLGVYSPEEMDAPVPKEQSGSSYSPPTSSSAKSATPSESSPAPSTGPRFVGIMGLADETPVDEQLNAEYTEDVPIYDPATGEQIGMRPALTSAQNKHIHALLDQLGHHMDDPKAPGERGKYRKKLKEKFAKESTALLATHEASWSIDWLLKCVAKLEKAMAPPPEAQP